MLYFSFLLRVVMSNAGLIALSGGSFDGNLMRKSQVRGEILPQPDKNEGGDDEPKSATKNEYI
jgi:hypothetical protein